MEDKISFELLTDNEENYKNIFNWCQKEHVYKWFEQRKLSYDEVVKKYKNKIFNSNQEVYLIRYNNLKIGLIQIYPYDNEIVISNCTKIYEYDIFIGEDNYISKGIGSLIVKKANIFIFDKYKADCIVLRPFKKNEKAVKCYLKNDYKIIKEYDGKDTLGKKEKYYLMINEKNKNVEVEI